MFSWGGGELKLLQKTPDMGSLTTEQVGPSEVEDQHSNPVRQRRDLSWSPTGGLYGIRGYYLGFCGRDAQQAACQLV